MTGQMWCGSKPEICDLCRSPIVDGHFVDGRTVFGPWANMCPDCHKGQGQGLGIGRGQEYVGWAQVAGGSSTSEASHE